MIVISSLIFKILILDIYLYLLNTNVHPEEEMDIYFSHDFRNSILKLCIYGTGSLIFFNLHYFIIWWIKMVLGIFDFAETLKKVVCSI